MKAVFIARTGALVEGNGARFTLRCGAGAGLRQLAEQDFRLIVIENGAIPATFLADARNHRRRRGDRWRPLDDAPDGDLEWYTAPNMSGQRWIPPGEALNALDPLESGKSPGPGRPPDAGQLLDGAKPPQPHAQPADASTSPVDAAGNGEPGIDFDIDFDFGFDLDHEAWDSRAAEPVRGGCIADRLGDLLFREQVPLQGFYSCTHGKGRGANGGHPATVPGGASGLGMGVGAAGRAGAGWSDSIPPIAFTPWQGEAPASGQYPPRCGCAPPQPGLLLRAAFEQGIELANSWLIGASLDMIEAGNRAGCRTVLLDNGTELTWRLGRGRVPTRIAPDLHAAALLINDEGARKRPW